MFTRKFLPGALMSVMMIVLVSSCRQRDALLPDNLVVFETATQGIAAADNSIVIKLKLSAAAGAGVPIPVPLFTIYTLLSVATAATAAMAVRVKSPLG